MNKRGFHWFLFCPFSSSPCSILFPFLLHIIQGPHPLLLFFFFVPQQVSNHSPFAYLSLSSLSSTILHHVVQLRITPVGLTCFWVQVLQNEVQLRSLYQRTVGLWHICCKTRACFIVPVGKSDKDTFLPVIRAHVISGGTCDERHVESLRTTAWKTRAMAISQLTTP